MAKDFKDLLVWREARKLTKEIYQVTAYFPEIERFGLTNQLRRAAVSVISNIAEGQARATTKDFLHFLTIAKGSLAEVECQIIISHDLGYISNDQLAKIDNTRLSTLRLLILLIKSLNNKIRPT
ncbi:MAG: four helix bundle protein [Muribaculaceae bacterium]|nr:four helix bundle protein [Muribaculaceae bacterium]